MRLEDILSSEQNLTNEKKCEILSAVADAVACADIDDPATELLKQHFNIRLWLELPESYAFLATQDADEATRLAYAELFQHSDENPTENGKHAHSSKLLEWISWGLTPEADASVTTAVYALILELSRTPPLCLIVTPVLRAWCILELPELTKVSTSEAEPLMAEAAHYLIERDKAGRAARVAACQNAAAAIGGAATDIAIAPAVRLQSRDALKNLLAAVPTPLLETLCARCKLTPPPRSLLPTDATPRAIILLTLTSALTTGRYATPAIPIPISAIPCDDEVFTPAPAAPVGCPARFIDAADYIRRLGSALRQETAMTLREEARDAVERVPRHRRSAILSASPEIVLVGVPGATSIEPREVVAMASISLVGVPDDVIEGWATLPFGSPLLLLRVEGIEAAPPRPKATVTLMRPAKLLAITPAGSACFQLRIELDAAAYLRDATASHPTGVSAEQQTAAMMSTCNVIVYRDRKAQEWGVLRSLHALLPQHLPPSLAATLISGAPPPNAAIPTAAVSVWGVTTRGTYRATAASMATLAPERSPSTALQLIDAPPGTRVLDIAVSAVASAVGAGLRVLVVASSAARVDEVLTAVAAAHPIFAPVIVRAGGRPSASLWARANVLDRLLARRDDLLQLVGTRGGWAACCADAASWLRTQSTGDDTAADIARELDQLEALELLRTPAERSDWAARSYARIVGCTATHIALRFPSSYAQQAVVVVDAARIGDVESLLALANTGVQHAVFIGDSRSLRPIADVRGSLPAQSLFARLARCGAPSTTLIEQSQYPRALAAVWRWRYPTLRDSPLLGPDPPVSNGFVLPYQLVSLTPTGQRDEELAAGWVVNVAEAEAAAALWMYARLVGMSIDQIAIVAMYKAQKRLIREVVTKRSANTTFQFGKAIVATADKFAARHRKLVIVSTVRTTTVGHLSSVARFVAALSAAEETLVVLGAPSLLGSIASIAPAVSVLLTQPPTLQLRINETRLAVQDVKQLQRIVGAMIAKDAEATTVPLAMPQAAAPIHRLAATGPALPPRVQDEVAPQAEASQPSPPQVLSEAIEVD